MGAKRIDWSQVDWRLPNVRIAKLIGCSREAVRVARLKVGIEPDSTDRTALRAVLKQRLLDAGAGTKFDSEVARSMGVTTQRVYLLRKEFGIPAFRTEASKVIDDPRLGKISDTELAKARGVSVFSVWKARTKGGIPARFATGEWNTARGKRSWDPANDHLLGTMTDGALSTLIDYTGQTIMLRRRKLGIESFKARTRRELREQEARSRDRERQGDQGLDRS